MGIFGFLKRKPGLGYKPDPHDHRDIAFKAAPALVGLPESVDLRPYVSQILHQGSTSSCVAHAYACAIDIRETMAGLDQQQPSRLFLYYYARALDGDTKRDAGTYLRSGAKALQILGCPEETTWPFEPSKINKAPSARAQLEAFPRRAGRYDRISELGHAKIPVIQAALASGHGVVFGTDVYESFCNVNSMAPIQPPKPGDRNIGGHAMCIVGYDSTGLWVANSWGPGWGDHGFAVFSYEYAARAFSDIWVIHGWKRIALRSDEVTHAG